MRRRARCLLALLVLAGSAVAGTIDVVRADRTYYNDRLSPTQPVQLMGGDLNGDGRRDLLVLLQSSGWEVEVFLGGGEETANTFTDRRAARLLPPAGATASLKLADMNGDGRDDLLLLVAGDLRVYLTPSALPAQWDLSSAVPDLALTGGAVERIAVGDLNGDGQSDLALGSPTASPAGRTEAGRCYLYFSSGTWTGGSSPIASHPRIRMIDGKSGRLGSSVLIGDMNHDGIDDVILSAPYAGGGVVSGPFGVANGEVYALFDAVAQASTFDLAVSTPDVTVRGYGSQLEARLVGDVNGDGAPELLVSRLLAAGLVDGADLTSGRTRLDFDPASGAFVACRGFWSGIVTYYSDSTGLGDFDGDGVEDLFVGGATPPPFNAPYVGGALSSESPTIPFPLVDRTTPSLTFPSGTQHHLLMDWNGDGRADVVLYRSYPTPQAPGVSYGELNVYFGFSPLWDPAAEVKAVTPGRVRLGLGVRGRAAEVRFTGDVEAGENGRWMPYAGERTVTLTGTGGTKSVQVTYRDAEGRESAVVTVNVTPPEGGGGVTVFNNRVTGDSPGAVDVDMPRGGHVRARVVSRRGREIATVMDEDRGPGVTAVTWDGKNEAGEAVAAGVYTLVIDYGGRRDRRTVVVER